MQTFRCPKCRAKVGAYPGSRIFCVCGHEYRAQSPVHYSQPQAASPYNHWFKLHRYAPSNRESWDAKAAKLFMLEWLRGVPRQCCWGNFQPILHDLGQAYDSPEAFAYKSWQWHDAVSKKLGKPRISWGDCLASWWGEVEPSRPNLLITVATGKCLPELEVVRPSLQAYADKIDADLIALVNTTEPWWGFEKFRVQQFVPKYSRTLFVDCDVVISPDCQNLFDVVPESHVGLHDDWPYLPQHDWLKPEVEAVCHSQGWEVNYRETCLNSGVVVCSRDHRIWDRPNDRLPTSFHCAEQIAVEQRVFRQGTPWFPLETKFNTQWWMPDYGKTVGFAAIDHLANSKNKLAGLKCSMKRCGW